MADTLGEAYLQIIVQGIDQAISEMKRLETATESSAKKSEGTINNLSNLKRQILNQDIKAAQEAQSQLESLEGIASSRKMQRINEINAAYQKNIDAYKNLATNAGRSSQEIQNHLSTMAQRVKSDLKEIEDGIGRGGVGFMTASMNILKAAPAFAVATAAIGTVYGALRGLRDEFTGGLAAVEDYQLKVASMGAFLTTFNKNLTQTNAAEIYRSSNVEAQKLVDTMQILDARTIASGKDLTTMAEQFIKGGVKIDTSNKGTLDGFVNIANALKLLTQGQNQEIQMRQEIRALTQGQVRDQNIVVQTLKGIDPEIKEHIKLWKQQGTLIENVGRLLAGFGPAAKDLEKTWAVVGSTMSTIHDRILRGAFKPTYDSLIQTAKEWNRALMDSEGNLTGLAKGIQNGLSGILLFSKNLLEVAGYVAIGGVIYVGILGITTLLEVKLAGAIYKLNTAMSANPLFMAALLFTSIASVKTWAESVSNDMKKIEEEGKRPVTAWENIKLKFAESASIMLSTKPFANFFNGIIEYTWNADTHVKNLLIKLKLLKGEISGGGDAFPTLGRTNQGGTLIPGSQLRTARQEIDTEELNKGIDALKKHNEELDRQNSLYKKNNVEQERYELTLGKYAETLRGLRATGKESAAQAFEDAILRKAATKDMLESSEKLRSEQKSANEKLKSEHESALKAVLALADSYKVKDVALEKSNLQTLNATLATKEWVEKIAAAKRGGHEASVEAAIDAAKVAAALVDQDKAYKDNIKSADDYYNKLQTKLESLQAAPGETEQLLKWEDKFVDAMFKAGSSASITATELDNIYEKLAKFSEMKIEIGEIIREKEFEKISKKFDQMNESFTTGPEKIEAGYAKAVNEIDKLLVEYDKLVLAEEKIGNKVDPSKREKISSLYGKEYETYKEKMKEEQAKASEFTKIWEGAAKNVEKAMSDFIFNPFEKGTQGMLKSFGVMLQRMIADAVAADLARKIFGDEKEHGQGGWLGMGLSLASAYMGGGASAPMEGLSQVGSYESMVGTSSSFSMGESGSSFADTSYLNASPSLPSFAVGTDFVEKDMIAKIHKGERIVPAAQNKSYNNSTNNSSQSTNIVVNVASGSPEEVRRSAAQGARTALGALSTAKRFA